MIEEFNMVIVGVGGQGVLTLQNIIADAALKQGYDVKTSELHGLAQRGGHIPSHIKFGKKIYSPLVLEGKANLVIGLEPLEALRACRFGSKENKTVFIIDNNRITPMSVTILNQKYPSVKEIKNILEKSSSKVFILNATEIAKKAVGTTAPANVYLLGYAYHKKLIPIKKQHLLEAIKETVPEKYFEMNKKIFELPSK